MTPYAPPPQLTYLPQPWGNCRAESGLREPELQGYSAYSVSACRLRCEKEAVLQRCHCRMVHMPGGRPPLPLASATLPGSRSSRAEGCPCAGLASCEGVRVGLGFLKRTYLFI